jgi:hypothetical protein
MHDVYRVKVWRGWHREGWANAACETCRTFLRQFAPNRRAQRLPKTWSQLPCPWLRFPQQLGQSTPGRKFISTSDFPISLSASLTWGFPSMLSSCDGAVGSWVSKRRSKNWVYSKTARIRPVDDNYKSSPSILVRLTLYT